MENILEFVIVICISSIVTSVIFVLCFKEKQEDTVDTVSCERCKCLINKSYANIVNVISIQKYEYYYCEKCKPPYTKIVHFIYSDNMDRYYKECEVDINGKIIK